MITKRERIHKTLPPFPLSKKVQKTVPELGGGGGNVQIGCADGAFGSSRGGIGGRVGEIRCPEEFSSFGNF
jgi:hypothetical protein